MTEKPYFGPAFRLAALTICFVMAIIFFIPTINSPSDISYTITFGFIVMMYLIGISS